MAGAVAATPPVAASQVSDAAPAPVAAVETAQSAEQADQEAAAAVVKGAVEAALITAQQAAAVAESTAATTQASVLAIGKQEGANLQMGDESVTVQGPMNAKVATAGTKLTVTPVSIDAT